MPRVQHDALTARNRLPRPQLHLFNPGIGKEALCMTEGHQVTEGAGVIWMRT